MVEFLYKEDNFEIIEQSTLLIFNFKQDKDIFGFSISKKSISPKTFAAAVSGLRDYIEYRNR